MPLQSSQTNRGRPLGRPAAPSSVPPCGWAGPGLLDSPRPEPPGPSSSGTARGPPAGSERGHRISFPGLPSCPAALCDVPGGVPRATGWLPQMAIPSVRTWWQRRSGFLPRVSATSVTNFVGRKEADRVGSWRLRCFYLTDKLKQVRTLRVLDTSTLSVVSAITLCIRSGCLSLTARAPESSLRLSLESPLHGCFIWSPRQLLQSETGVPHFALDPLTYSCLLSLSPAADFAEPRPPRHRRHSLCMNKKLIKKNKIKKNPLCFTEESQTVW